MPNKTIEVPAADFIPVKTHTTKWHALRKNGIGGSDAGAVLGINRYSSPLDVWLEKTGRREPADLSDNEKVYWGSMLEDSIAKAYLAHKPQRQGMKLIQPKGLYVSKLWPWMVANVDRLIYQSSTGEYDGILEVKTAGSDAGWFDEEGNETIPDSYLAQVLHYLAVTGLEWAVIVCLIAGQRYIERLVLRDEYAQDIDHLIEREREFWFCYVQEEVMPALIGNEDEGAALFAMYPEGADIKLMDDEAEELCKIYNRFHEIEKAAALDKQAAANKLRLWLGKAKGSKSETVSVTWKRFDKAYFDKKKFEHEWPELAAQYTSKRPHDGGLLVTVKEGN